ncbi:hypothetical protein Vretimale_12757 [Volvox reticuliferus]|uniref:Uncharacterized protein n=1 Tax=Volvox reticuliferus TaxID=1737510 RepID=A0A8J4GJY8_9CHLO|nr:hypothetical protein Vretimale_12757 [Volvox reticuliferus]
MSSRKESPIPWADMALPINGALFGATEEPEVVSMERSIGFKNLGHTCDNSAVLQMPIPRRFEDDGLDTAAPLDQSALPAPTTPERTERSSAVRTYVRDDEEEGESLEGPEVLGAFDPMDVDVLAWSEAESEEDLTVEMEDVCEFPDRDEVTSRCMVRPADSTSHQSTCPSGAAPSSPPLYAPPWQRLDDYLEEQLYSPQHTASFPSPSPSTISPTPSHQSTPSQFTASSNASYGSSSSQRRRRLGTSGPDLLVRSDSVASGYRRSSMPVARNLKRRADSYIEGEEEDSPAQKRYREQPESTEVSGAWVTTAVVEDEAESAPAVEDETEVEDQVEADDEDEVEVEVEDEVDVVVEAEIEDEVDVVVEAEVAAEDEAMDVEVLEAEDEAMDVEVVEVDAMDVDGAEFVNAPYRPSELLDGSGSYGIIEDRFAGAMEMIQPCMAALSPLGLMMASVMEVAAEALLMTGAEAVELTMTTASMTAMVMA